MDDAVVEEGATCAQQSLLNIASNKLRAHYATLEQFQSVREQIIDNVLAGFGSVTDKKYGPIDVMDAINQYRKLVEERQERRVSRVTARTSRTVPSLAMYLQDAFSNALPFDDRTIVPSSHQAKKFKVKKAL